MTTVDPPGIATAQRWLLPMLARYFRLELRGSAANIPDWRTQPCIFVMNHTALVGLEVWLLFAALKQLRPEAPRPRATVWPPFLDVPGLGPFYRAAGCMPMTVPGATQALRAGESVLILPEGPDATDVRDEIGPFHAGFLRVVRALLDEGRQVPVVPLGWAGVDEANPWWVTTHPLLVRMLMKPAMPRFDFALLPRPPLLRPSKVVFVAGTPERFRRGDLDEEAKLRAAVTRMRDRVIELVVQAKWIREARIEASRAEQLVHALARCRRVAWERR